jgi:hypothetical protein
LQLAIKYNPFYWDSVLLVPSRSRALFTSPSLEKIVLHKAGTELIETIPCPPRLTLDISHLNLRPTL